MTTDAAKQAQADAEEGKTPTRREYALEQQNKLITDKLLSIVDRKWAVEQAIKLAGLLNGGMSVSAVREFAEWIAKFVGGKDGNT
jgi:hypothetical protein